MNKIAIIGLGTMGRPMAAQVIDAGFELCVYDLNSEPVEAMVEAGASSSESAAEAASGVDIVLLSLPGPTEVVETISGPNGILAATPKPQVIVDLSTNSVETVRELAQLCAQAGVSFVDAPVSGGVAKAKTGELSVMVGSDQETLDLVQPVLGAIGSEIFLVGPVGSGTIAKLVNNQLFLVGSVLVQEAFVLAQALGLEPAMLNEVVGASSGGFYTRLAPLVLGRRFDDVAFRLDIAAKDVAMAVQAANSVGSNAPLTEVASELYSRAVEAGRGHQAFHATLPEIEQASGVELPALRRPRKNR